MDTKLLNDEELDQVTGGTILPHVVMAGDSIASVAKKYHVSEEQICRWNNLPGGSMLTVGQKLIIKF